MSLFHLILIALIQGITEFLPVSSSGHLILLPNLTGFGDQGLAIDVAVHVGSLGAVILYFWDDVRRALRGIPGLLRWQIDSQDTWPGTAHETVMTEGNEKTKERWKGRDADWIKRKRS